MGGHISGEQEIRMQVITTAGIRYKKRTGRVLVCQPFVQM